MLEPPSTVHVLKSSVLTVWQLFDFDTCFGQLTCEMPTAVRVRPSQGTTQSSGNQLLTNNVVTAEKHPSWIPRLLICFCIAQMAMVTAIAVALAIFVNSHVSLLYLYAVSLFLSSKFCTCAIYCDFYAPNFEEVWEAYWFGPVRPSVCYTCTRSRTVRDRILKFG